ncbi:zinc finger protein 260-like isoform X2 [Bacillus rossius redtenbacheri]|uniref:zinc finger protein 260-like isoform X2 n=1 Tax=Bacillus rossius redtenbacheri TaxID=93214 RepID=UPI002FDEAE9F
MEKTRKRYGATWCSAPNCSNNSDQLEKRSFFRFPKDELLCRKWVVECRRSDLEDKSAAYLYKNCRICSDHFEHVMFLNDLKNRRHSHAVPTLFNVPKPPCIQSLKKQGEYNEIQPEIRRLIPGLSTDNARTEEYTTPNLTMETDGVHVKEEPVMADSFETVFVTVKEEVESEDEAEGEDEERAAPCSVTVESAPSSIEMAKGQTLGSAGGLACEQLAAPATYAGCANITECIGMDEEKTDERDPELSCSLSNNELTPQSSSSFQSADFETFILSLEKKDIEEYQLMNDPRVVSLVANNINGTQNDDRPFQCSVCAVKLRNKYILVNHMKKHAGEKPFSCSLCSAKFVEKHRLSNHMRKHTGEKRYSCALCLSKYFQKSSLVAHIRTHSGDKMFSCSLCSSKFTERHFLTRHLKTHSGDKPFSCALCSSKFTAKGSLVTHLKLHNGEKPFSCSLCSSKFITKSKLNVHIRRNTGEKLYSCSLCSYKFFKKGNLDIHMRKHTGEKQYSCSLCSLKFSRKCYLRKHLERHNGEKLFTCSLCPAKFFKESNSIVHMTLHTEK